MAASKCSQNHFISARYETAQLYNSTSDCKSVGNISGSHFVKAFSVLPSHS